MTKERTLVILKPDAEERRLIGKILAFFEKDRGIRIVAMRMTHATSAQLDTHFPVSREWVKDLGVRAQARLSDNDSYLRFGSDDPRKIGSLIIKGCREYYLSGPLVVLVLEGPDVIQTVRDMLGNALPEKPNRVPIRGDFGDKNQQDGDINLGVTRNLVHASERDDVEREIACWFPELSLEIAGHMYVVSVTCVLLSLDTSGLLRALIVKRSEREKDGGGCWAIPGGKIDPEDWGVTDPRTHSRVKTWSGVARRALCRELKEEVGVSVNIHNVHVFFKHGDTVFVRSDGIPGFIVRHWTVLKTEPDIILDPSLSEFRWISYGEIADYEFLGNIGEDIRVAFNEAKFA